MNEPPMSETEVSCGRENFMEDNYIIFVSQPPYNSIHIVVSNMNCE